MVLPGFRNVIVRYNDLPCQGRSEISFVGPFLDLERRKFSALQVEYCTLLDPVCQGRIEIFKANDGGG
jgi:hypothetical protein